MRFSSVIAGIVAVHAIAAASMVSAQPPGIEPSQLSPCPFTPEEIRTELGLNVKPGQPVGMWFPGARDVGCLYEIKDSSSVFTVRQTWDPSGHGAGDSAAEKVMGDPDGARVQASSRDDEHVVELGYTRANGRVRTKLVARGRSIDPEAMPPRLVRLRRVP